MYFNKKHKETIENREDNYEYICSYHNKEMTIDKKKYVKKAIWFVLNVHIVEKNMMLD